MVSGRGASFQSKLSKSEGTAGGAAANGHQGAASLTESIPADSKAAESSRCSPSQRAQAAGFTSRFMDDHDTVTEESSEGTPSPEQKSSGGNMNDDMDEGLTATTERVAASQKERVFFTSAAALDAAESVRSTGNVAFSAGSLANALTLYEVALRHLEEARKLQTGLMSPYHTPCPTPYWLVRDAREFCPIGRDVGSGLNAGQVSHQCPC